MVLNGWNDWNDLNVWNGSRKEMEGATNVRTTRTRSLFRFRLTLVSPLSPGVSRNLRRNTDWRSSSLNSLCIRRRRRKKAASEGRRSSRATNA